jgi:hypothetical protein
MTDLRDLPPQELLRRAREARPNAFAAEDLFRSDWQGRTVPGPMDGILAVTVVLDHVGASNPTKRLSRRRDGWSAVLHLDRTGLSEHGRERPIALIHQALEAQMEQLLVRVGKLRPPPAG